MESLELRWDSASHVLRIIKTFDGIQVEFTIVKPQATQIIRRHFACENLSLKDIEDAWEFQGKKWHEMGRSDDGKGTFTAVRLITLPKDLSLVWYVFHRFDAPFDSVELMKM